MFHYYTLKENGHTGQISSVFNIGNILMFVVLGWKVCSISFDFVNSLQVFQLGVFLQTEIFCIKI